jgi:hypothetical protein
MVILKATSNSSAVDGGLPHHRPKINPLLGNRMVHASPKLSVHLSQLSLPPLPQWSSTAQGQPGSRNIDEKRFQEAAKPLPEATQKLHYLNQKETYETAEAQKYIWEQVKVLTKQWEVLALELEETKMTNILSNAKE